MSKVSALNKIINTLSKDPENPIALGELDRIFEEVITSDNNDVFLESYSVVESWLTADPVEGSTTESIKTAS